MDESMIEPVGHMLRCRWGLTGAGVGCAQVIWGVKDGAANETSMVAILSEPRYNASGDTLSFAVQPVTEAASLKLSEGTANAALLGNPASRLNSTTVGLILKDIVIYIDDSTGDVSARPPLDFQTKPSLRHLAGMFSWC